MIILKTAVGREKAVQTIDVHDHLEQRVAWADELDVGVADDPILVEGELRVGLADLAEAALDGFGSAPQPDGNLTDRPEAGAASLGGRDRAAERAVRLDEEPLDVFRHEPLFTAFLHVLFEFGQVDVP